MTEDCRLLLAAVYANPSDQTGMLALADAFDEAGNAIEAASWRLVANTGFPIDGWRIEIERPMQEVEHRGNIHTYPLPIRAFLENESAVRPEFPLGGKFGPIVAIDRNGVLWRCRAIFTRAIINMDRDCFTVSLEAIAYGSIEFVEGLTLESATGSSGS